MHLLAEQIVRQHISVTGVQPKLSLDLETEAGQSRLTIVGLWGNYILKPPYLPYPEMPEVEDLTMHLAQLMGVQTVPHALVRLESGELAYLTKRIDRSAGQKRAMEDFCQLSERLTVDKYRGSMESVAKVIRKYSQQPQLDCLALFETTLFCFLTGNADMHLKNFSLWQTEAGYQLTPAYDLLATKMLLPSDLEELALPLNGKKSRFKDTDWAYFGTYLKLTERQQANVFKRVSDRISKAERLIEISFLSTSMKKSYIDLLRERYDRLIY